MQAGGQVLRLTPRRLAHKETDSRAFYKLMGLSTMCNKEGESKNLDKGD